MTIGACGARLWAVTSIPSVTFLDTWFGAGMRRRDEVAGVARKEVRCMSVAMDRAALPWVRSVVKTIRVRRDGCAIGMPRHLFRQDGCECERGFTYACG